MGQSNTFFATAKPTRLFFKVAMPGMISMLAASIYSIMEGIFIGHFVGEAAFAAINIGFPFVFLNFSLADLVGVGSSAPIAIALGRKEEGKACNVFSCSIILIFLAAVLMGTVLFFTAPYLVALMGAKGELARLAVEYVQVFALMGPLTTIVFAMDNYLRISGFVKGSMFLNLFMSGLTIALIALFVGVLKLGVLGAAFASNIAMSVCAVIAFIPFLRKKAILKLVRPRFSFGLIKEIVACGSPIFLNNVSGRVAAILMNTVLLKMGGEEMGQTAVAAYGVLMYAGSVIEPLLYGMCDSVQPAVGYNWGAKSLERVRDISKIALLACAVVSVIGFALMLLLPEQIAFVFVDKKDVALMELSSYALKFFSTAYIFRWAGFAVQSFYTAIEKPLPAAVISVCSACVFPIIFIFALWGLGLDGLWLNCTATSLVIMIMSFIMLRISQKRIKTDILKEKKE